MNRQEANNRITGGFLGGSLDHYGIRNLKSIVLNDRALIVKDLTTYAKQHAASAEYIKQYMTLKENNKPKAIKVETPEELRAKMIAQAKESLRQTEESSKKATAEMKPMFEKIVEAARQNLKSVEDPNNKSMKSYAQSYENLKLQMQQSHENLLKNWEEKYPTNHLLYIKVRLQEFLDATNDVDFTAQLTERNGIKYFVNPIYERKSDRWKMAFRAGKGAVEEARTFAQQWLLEIK